MKQTALWLLGIVPILLSAAEPAPPAAVTDSSPLSDKAVYLQRDLLEKHWIDGLYVSIVPVTQKGTSVPHTVNQPGNVIHAGVWTGRYLGGVGYHYAMTQDPWVREHGGQILRALRIQQEVTGKPGLLARDYVKGHGPVEDGEVTKWGHVGIDPDPARDEYYEKLYAARNHATAPGGPPYVPRSCCSRICSSPTMSPDRRGTWTFTSALSNASKTIRIASVTPEPSVWNGWPG